MSHDAPWTIRRILDWTREFLAGKGVESPRVEAELLLSHAMQCERIRLYTNLDEPVADAARALMRDYVRRRAAREPLAYITGVREFYGREFQVTQDVLIPRPETESLIDACLELIPKNGGGTVVEIGTGSGCLCITLALQRPQLQLISLDVSDAALQIAAENVRRHGVTDRVRLLRCEGTRWGAALSAAAPVGFLGVVSNPPYVCDGELAELEPEVRSYEPQVALTAGEDGLDIVRQLVPWASGVVSTPGWLALELDPAQTSVAAALCRDSGWSEAHVVKDLQKNDRCVMARK